jgi:hypothetical protein
MAELVHGELFAACSRLLRRKVTAPLCVVDGEKEALLMRKDVLRRPRALKSTALLLTLALAGMVAACGTSTNVNLGGGPPPTVHCSEATVGHGVDVVNTKLTCTVSGAASSDTSFTLHYAIKHNGSSRPFDATCDGKLQNGTGTCTQTYALVVPFDDGSATVSGELLPSHESVGPLTPTGSQQ